MPDSTTSARRAWKPEEAAAAPSAAGPAPAPTYQDYDDDGESAAGGRLLHLLQLMDVWNVVVVVTRWYGGVHLGPDRFRLINAAAREASPSSAAHIASASGHTGSSEVARPGTTSGQSAAGSAVASAVCTATAIMRGV